MKRAFLFVLLAVPAFGCGDSSSSVSLQVNGTTIGTSAGAERIFQWANVALNTGANTIVATGTTGTTTATDTVVWTRQ